MAETSYLWDNPGTGDSPALGYGHAELMEEMFRMIFNGTGNQGVLRGWLNQLEVTDGGGLNASVDTGGAVVYGFWYENDAAVNVAMPNNATNLVVVRCSWAAQTARLTQVGALVQNPGVTYDIPLAEVTTAAGVITLVTDTREYCFFTTAMIDNVVETEHIQADAITTAKLENQTRWLTRGVGAMEPDVTNPPAWGDFWRYPKRSYWDHIGTTVNGTWVTFRVPSDFTGATVAVHYWNTVAANSQGAFNVVWDWDAWIAAAGGVLGNQAGTITIDVSGRSWYDGAYRDQLTTLNVSAGDIIHINISRDGPDGADTSINAMIGLAVEISYTADS